MAAPDDAPNGTISSMFGGVTQGPWLLGAAALLATGLVLHALLPRYEFSRVNEGGTAAVFVFDRWTGQFQRVQYGPDGEPAASSVVRPF